ncbi:girdin isoform X7 [Xenopus laevis]|uniref:Girdin isoform X7 n=1 Tax=Xenopus laevis TaxID=8355 RepID=A0A8J1KU27_XENLA|nr:girdin isoform X7 [Xenopus laevis]
MENEIFAPILENFMFSPLVIWIKTFGTLLRGAGTLLDEYVALIDGVFLNEVMLQINPKADNQRIYRKINNDASLRIQNLSVLVKQMKSYYQESLQQLVMMSLPNVLTIGKNPYSEQGTEEMKKLLLLMLGCAVQSERKEEFIEKIQVLDFDTKAAVAAHIQEVTHNQENVFDLQLMEPTEMSSEDLEAFLKNISFHLKRLVDERDEYTETIIELTEERDSLHFAPLATSAQSPSGSPSMRRTESRQHLSVELADAKAKIRRLRQELEEKTEQFLDSKQEVGHLEAELKRVQQENMNLLADARSARVYRDELDALREKAIRVDKLESELSRYKERMHDIEFYKARVEELKEDNQVLLETKTMLEDQLEGARARSDKLHELEKENLQMKARFHDMETERDLDRKRIEELMEENMSLEMAQKQSMDESLHLGWELEQLSKTSELPETPQKSLGHEVNELTSSRLLKLEMENQTLLSTVEELRITMSSTDAKNTKILKLEKENQRLSKKMEKLEGVISHERQNNETSQHLSSDLMKEKSELEKTIETLRENSERQIKGLEQENEHLNQTISSLRQRSQISAEARVRDIEKENKILHESIKETSSKLNKMEFEKKQMKKELEHFKEMGERSEELEKELHRVEKENELLQKKITSLNIVCEKTEALEQENASLELEKRKLKKTLDSLKNLKYQMESLEKENNQLDEENLNLRRSVESLKSTNIKMAQLELENKELENEKEQLRKGLELMKASCKKTERLEVSYQGLDTENQRLQKALENSSKKIQQLENELQDLEAENQTLQKNLEELKISSKRLEQLEKETKLLEQETCLLEKDKKQLEKENKRLRQQAEIKDITLEENNARISNLERENKLLSKETNAFKESCARMKELEMENKELVKRATIDKKTLVTLREDLVNEKLKTQQINNELEKLTHELEKIGLNKERLLHDEQTTDDSRYKLLESKLESTLKKSLEIKEEKIASLEARLEESANFNQQLRQELKTVKKNYEGLKQRQEEERLVHTSPPRPGEENLPVPKWERESQETTRELLKIKDRLIEVERNNATLYAEKQAQKTQLKQLETQNDNLQAQILALQKQTISLQEQNTTLQTQNAKLQVENSTINSQSTSLMNQNSQLLMQQSSLENENESLTKEREELKAMYELLVKDHEKLAQVHERQAAEYESLISKHGSLKSAHKNLEVEHKDLEDRYNQLLKQKVQLEELEKALKEEQAKMLQENKQHKMLSSDYQRLTEEHGRLNHTYRQLLRENESLQSDHKNLKSLLNSGKLEQTRLEAEFSKLKEQYQQLDITSTKLNNQCELLSQLKGNLEEENRHLLDQIQTLMLQNRTLLEQNMESKDLFQVEQRQYIDKLNELRRQKEKLEEKIMDQYKFHEPSPPRRRGNWITLKMRKLIKSKKDNNRERLRSLTMVPSRSESSEGFLQLPLGDSQDSSSVGSNSLEDGHPLGAKKSSRMVASQIRSHSHIGGDFSLHQESEPLNGSGSPVPYLGHRLKKSAVSSPMLRPQLGDTPETSLQPKLKPGSPRSEKVSLKQFLEESNKLTVSQIRSGSQENLLDEVMRSLSSSVESAGFHSPTLLSPGLSLALDRKSAKPEQSVRPNLRKTESLRFTFPELVSSQSSDGSSAIVDGTVFSQKHTKDSNPYATLPRASSVISTAEGTTRRTSIHDFLSKDNRSPVSVDPSPTAEDEPCLSSEYCIVMPRACLHAKGFDGDDRNGSHNCHVCKLDQFSKDNTNQPYSSSTVQNPIKTEGTSMVSYTSPCMSYPYLSLNTDLVSSISGLPASCHCAFSVATTTNDISGPPVTKSDIPNFPKDDCECPVVQGPSDKETEISLSVTEDNQSIWYEYGCV